MAKILIHKDARVPAIIESLLMAADWPYGTSIEKDPVEPGCVLLKAPGFERLYLLDAIAHMESPAEMLLSDITGGTIF